MRRATISLLCLLVFCIPWEQFIVAFNVSSLTRLIGIAAIGLGLVTVIATGRIRRPGLILYMAVAFTGTAALSFLWSIAPSATVSRTFQYGQLLGFTWLVSEFVRTDDDRQMIMVAYTAGAYVAMLDLLRRFAAGEDRSLRYSATNLNPNDLGLTLAIGVPMAWYLVLNRRGLVRVVAAMYIPLVAVAILLTASRGASLAYLAAISIVPLTLSRRSLVPVLAIVTISAATAVAAMRFVPQYNWDRILNTGEELAEGTMSGRTGIWAAGWQVFKERPVLGVGGGAFEWAVEPEIGHKSPHNVFLAIAVEQGGLGFLVFGLLLASCAYSILRMPPADRKIWAVAGFTWAVGSMSAGWQYRKETWLLFGLATVHVAAKAATSRRQRSPHAAAVQPGDAVASLHPSTYSRVGARRIANS